MLRRFSFAAATLSAFCLLSPLGAGAQQAPIALPNTVSTVAGGSTLAFTVGAACSPGSSQTATDTLGDGCPATSAFFNTPAAGDLRGGVATDPAGNIYVMDTEDAAVRMINARSGIITLAAGLGTVCSSKTDNNGDNCPLADTKFSSTPRGIASDPYGNILVAGNGSNLVNLICNAVSPLCPNTSGAHQVGSMYLVAGCVVNTGTAGTGGPGAATGANGGTATPTGTCSSSVTELDGPRGVAADRYGNVYIADTTNLRYRVVVGPATYNGVANPLAALIAINPTFIQSLRLRQLGISTRCLAVLRPLPLARLVSQAPQQTRLTHSAMAALISSHHSTAQAPQLSRQSPLTPMATFSSMIYLLSGCVSST